MGILFWLLGVVAIFSFNAYYFPHSFFAEPIDQYTWFNRTLLIASSTILVMATLFSYINCFLFKRYRLVGSIFILTVMAAGGGGFHDQLAVRRIIYEAQYYSYWIGFIAARLHRLFW